MEPVMNMKLLISSIVVLMAQTLAAMNLEYSEQGELDKLLAQEWKVVQENQEGGIDCHSNHQKIKELLQAGANPYTKNEQGLAIAFSVVCCGDNADFLELFLKAGFDIHHRTNIGKSLIVLAKSLNHPQCCDLLSKFGATLTSDDEQEVAEAMRLHELEEEFEHRISAKNILSKE